MAFHFFYFLPIVVIVLGIALTVTLCILFIVGPLLVWYFCWNRLEIFTLWKVKLFANMLWYWIWSNLSYSGFLSFSYWVIVEDYVFQKTKRGTKQVWQKQHGIIKQGKRQHCNGRRRRRTDAARRKEHTYYPKHLMTVKAYAETYYNFYKSFRRYPI